MTFFKLLNLRREVFIIKEEKEKKRKKESISYFYMLSYSFS